MLDHCRQGNGGGLIERVTEGASTQRRENDALDLILLREIEATLIGVMQQALVFGRTRIDWSNGMVDGERWQISSTRRNSAARRTPADGTAFRQEGWSSGYCQLVRKKEIY